MEASTLSWFNGAIGPREAGAPSVASINFHLGTSVFDGLVAYWNDDHHYLHRAEDHLRRFCAGSARLGLNFTWSVEEMLAGIEALLRHEGRHTQYVRPIAYRRGPELWVTGAEGRPVDVCIFTVPIPRDVDRMIACHVSPIERISSRSIPGQTKVSGSYVNSFHARREAEREGFDDAIMLDREGRIAEASAANIFLIRGKRLLTPRLNADVFPGVTRTVVLEIATREGIEAQEADLYVADLDACDGAFLCSTLMEVRGLSRLGTRHLETEHSEAYQTVLRSFRRLVHQ